MISAIIGGGIISDYSFLTENLKECDIIICADGGIKHLINVNIPPNIFIGDFDSCDFEKIKNLPLLEKTIIIRHTPIKDDTDMQLCIDWALDNGYNEIRIFAALGGRVDHELSNIFNLKYILKKGGYGTIISENNYIHITDNKISLKKIEGYKLSLISLADTTSGICLKGLYYPLDDAELAQGSSLGISNEFVDDKAEISIKKGLLLVMLSKDKE